MRGIALSPGGRIAAGLLLAWTLAVTVSRTVRWPNDFAEAHWLLDYRLGLVKRGLPGELVSLATGLVGSRPTEGLIAALSVAIFALLVLALLVVAWRIMVRDRWSAASVVTIAAFCSSSYPVMAAHLMGYFDHVVVLLGIASVALVLRGRAWWAFALLSVAVLVHEHTLVVGVPAALVAWLFASDGRRARGDVPLPFVPLVLPVLSLAALAVTGARLSPDVFQDTFVRHLEQYPFVGGDMHLFVPEWLAVSVLDSAGTQLHRFVERLTGRDILVLVLPTMLALMAFALDRFAVGRGLRVAALIVAVLAPQVLHMAGWDTVRIWTFSVAAAFVCAWIVAETCGPRGQGVSPAVLVSASGALVVNIVTAVPLYDNLAERHELSTRVLLYVPAVAVLAWLLFVPRRGPSGGDGAAGA